MTLVLLLDHSRVLLPDAADSLGRLPMAMRFVAIERFLLFGLLPLAVVVLAFPRPTVAVWIAIGDWRAGAVLMLVGCAVMTPLVLWFATLPDVRSYYASSVEPLPGLLLTNALDLSGGEFLFRGFLTFTLLRAIGPLGVVVATMPFVYVHLGKPELELYSTLARRADLRLAGMAHPIDPVGNDRARVHPELGDRRGRRRGDRVAAGAGAD